MRSRLTKVVLGVVACLAAAAPAARADVEIKDIPSVVDSFKVGLELHTLMRADGNPYFGGERETLSGSTIDDAAWGEIFAKFRLTAGKDLGWTELMAQFSPFYAKTVGQDVYGLFDDGADEFGVDQAWIELAKVFDSPFSVRVGRQDVQVEKWFLVGSNQEQEAAGWLLYRYSFPFAVQMTADFSPFKATAFWARAGSNLRPPDDADLFGMNLHYDFTESNYVYAGAYAAKDYPGLSSIANSNQNMYVWDVGGQFSLLDSLLFEGELAFQTGDVGEDGDRDAMAGFASVTWSMPFSYSPYLRGMYAYFSGDEDPDDGDEDGWDPFFNSFVGWNRWVLGEQTGEVWLLDTNKWVAVGEAGFSPVEAMTISLHYLRHTIAEEESFGTESDEWGDELNLFMDYAVDEAFFIHLGTGVVFPGDAAEEVAGDDKNAYFGQVWMTYRL